MGIVAFCPNGHRIKVKDELAGRKGICPTCAARFRIPLKSGPAETAAAGPPIARVVSLDPLFAASLPAALPLDEGETALDTSAAADPADAPPDFLLLEDETAAEERGAAGHDATAPAPDERPPPELAATHGTLDERPDLAWCIAVRGGAPSAPLDAAAMRGWLDSGAATADHVVWRQDWPDWRPLAEVFPEAVPPAAGDWP